MNVVGLVLFGCSLWYGINFLLQEYSPAHYVSTPGVVNITTVDYSSIGLAIFFLLATLFFAIALLFGGKIIEKSRLKFWVFTIGIILLVFLIAYYAWVFIVIEFLWRSW
jgi:hypothetical protein